MSPHLLRRARMALFCTATAAAAAFAPTARAYALMGSAWPSVTVQLQLQLDATAPTTPALPLQDGSTTWNALAQAAIADWNNCGTLVRTKLEGVTNTSSKAALSDNTNSIFFANTIYGDAFGQYVLAVTLVDNRDDFNVPSVRSKEADLIVNNTRTWSSYRGALQTNLDLRRVILHELGHVLGLDHPDEADPVQYVAAIMNHAISNQETVQSDDRAGIAYLYNTTLVVPQITTQPASQTVAVTGATTLSFGLNGGTPPAPAKSLLEYQWFFKATGASDFEPLFTVHSAALAIGSVQAVDAGSYYVRVRTPDQTVTSNTVTLTTTPVTISTGTALMNLSTRGVAGSGSSTMIVGFVVRGTGEQQVLLRAIGPTLGAKFGVAGTLSDPQLILANSSAATLAKSPAIWDGTNGTALAAAMAKVGAFPLPAGTADAVILATLQPGNYTAQVTSPSGRSGVVLVEAYADPTAGATSRLANLSTRGYVGVGSDALIAGFAVQGPGPRTYLIRVAGYSAEKYGMTGTVPDPILTLYQADKQLREDDDWDSPASAQPAIAAAFSQVGAFAFQYPSTVNRVRDRSAMQPAMLVTLPPGNYTAKATGNANDGTTSPVGNALIEIYEVP